MSGRTNGNSRYLKRKLDLCEADHILDGIIKSRKESNKQPAVAISQPQSETSPASIPLDVSSAASDSADHQFQKHSYVMHI